MTKKKENPFSPSLDAPVPEIYMPRLQLFIRLLLGAWRRYTSITAPSRRSFYL